MVVTGNEKREEVIHCSDHLLQGFGLLRMHELWDVVLIFFKYFNVTYIYRLDIAIYVIQTHHMICGSELGSES